MIFKRIENDNDKKVLSMLFDDDDTRNFLGPFIYFGNTNDFLCINDTGEVVGYFGYTDAVENGLGLNSSGLYYQVAKPYRGHGYSKQILGCGVDALKNDVDMFVLTIDNQNEFSKKTALSCGFDLSDDFGDEVIMVQYSKNLESKRR